jgi:CheY-like chemotaxis protein
MPVMNGFEATRAIRDFEEKTKAPNPAMIIALTGLASGRDQAEGFASGYDIYLTKPVSFNEVGRLLENWAANQKSFGSDGSGMGYGVTEKGLRSSSHERA